MKVTRLHQTFRNQIAIARGKPEKERKETEKKSAEPEGLSISIKEIFTNFFGVSHFFSFTPVFYQAKNRIVFIASNGLMKANER